MRGVSEISKRRQGAYNCCKRVPDCVAQSDFVVSAGEKVIAIQIECEAAARAFCVIHVRRENRQAEFTLGSNSEII